MEEDKKKIILTPVGVGGGCEKKQKGQTGKHREGEKGEKEKRRKARDIINTTVARGCGRAIVNGPLL